MVKPRAARKGKSRKPRRRQPNRRRVSLFPPIIPFDKVYLNVVLRNVIQNATQPVNSTIEGDITIKSIFDGAWSKLRECFSEVWFLKVHVYVMSGVGFDEPGYHLINVAPKQEYEVTAKTSFAMMASLPGTRTARLTRMVSGVWYPTGMDEKLWFKTDSPVTLTKYLYRSSCQKTGGQATASFPVDITIDCHVKLRGVNYTALARRYEDDGLDAEFVNLAT